MSSKKAAANKTVQETSTHHAALPEEAALSPHLRQRRRGYRWLLFERDLEHEFRQWYWQINADRARLSLLAGGIIFGLFAIKDAAVMPPEVSKWTVAIRFYCVMSAIALAYLVVRFSESQQVREAALLVAGIASLAGMAAAILISELLGSPLPYEGLILIICFLYFLIGMRTWRVFWTCLLVCIAIQASWRLTELDINQIRLRGYYLFAAVAIGGIGAYALEYQARGHFLALRIAGFRGNTDALTGRPNRRAILGFMLRTLRQARREQVPVGVFLIDVDYFKRYNDTYSHVAGDRCLKAVADACAEVFRRPMDEVGRLGGEEFLAIAYGTEPSHVETLGNRLCAAVRELNLPHSKGVDGFVSVSVGGFSVPPGTAADLTSLIHHADDAMYASKDAGRDRFTHAPAYAA